MKHCIQTISLCCIALFAFTSCSSSSSSKEHNTPIGQHQSIIESKISNVQKKNIQRYAQSKYGGFGNGQWGATGVLSMIVISVNGKFGSDHFFDGRGAYNNKFNGAYRIESPAGQVQITGKPDHYQIPKSYEHHLSFNAVAGHVYFLGVILDEKAANFRWTTVLYDKTDDKVIELKDQKIFTHPKPIVIYM